ncbi:hypothetical protein [Bradyrhizobium sp. Ec3.3]|uniref:hypothetical protein n=1 Tax=Bradyrhizobium sp. Ec3.3 TaxID=189753 RepID=UPI000413F050|nr:hypothetical protein [Bradyrhizobium sp. Ec3.3]
MARGHTALCVRTLAGIVSQEAAPPAARVAAAGILLDRGWGKPMQPIAGDDGQPLTIVIRQLLEPSDVDLTPTGPTAGRVN